MPRLLDEEEGLSVERQAHELPVDALAVLGDVVGDLVPRRLALDGDAEALALPAAVPLDGVVASGQRGLDYLDGVLAPVALDLGREDDRALLAGVDQDAQQHDETSM